MELVEHPRKGYIVSMKALLTFLAGVVCAFSVVVVSAETREQELLHAIADKDTKRAIRLLKEGAPHTFEDVETGTTPLMKAVGQLDAALIKALIRHGAKADFRTKSGDTALHTAAYMASASVWGALIQNEPDINVTNASGATPLMVASSIGNVAVVKSLINAKAEIEMQISDGNTALLLATMEEEREKERREVVLRLLQAKANPNHRNRKNYNALYYAVANEDDKMVKTLIENGARITKDGAEDRETWEIAKGSGNNQILKYLEAALESH